jgi:ankyrin repeat protein
MQPRRTAPVLVVLGLLLLFSSLARSSDSALDLLKAIESGNVERVSAMLQDGVDPNTSDKAGRTALMYAGINGQTHVMKMLIEKGANVNAEALRFNGVTPLIASVIFGDPEAIRLLIQHGAYVNARDRNGETVLTWAKRRLQLTQPGPPISLERNQNGDLPFATEREFREVIEILENAGAID